jgi:parallel beta-helix repeat protein
MAAIAALVLLSVAGVRANPLSGTYTVCSSGCDYSTLQDAANDLNNYGVSGAVTIDMAAGTHSISNTIYFGTINGTSSTNTVTIQGAGQGNTILAPVNNSYNYGYWLMQFGYTSYLTLKDMTIDSRNTTVGYSYTNYDSYYGYTYHYNYTYSYDVYVYNCDHVTITDCDLKANNSSNNASYWSGSDYYQVQNYGYPLQGYANTNLLIENCNVDGGDYGIYLYDYYNYNNNTGANKISNCKLKNYSYYGIYMYSYYYYYNNYNTTPIEIDGNEIDSSVNGNGSGILVQGMSAKITNNNVGPRNQIGIQYYAYNYYSNNSFEASVINNICQGTNYGLYIEGSNNTKISHNTAHNVGSAYNGAAAYIYNNSYYYYYNTGGTTEITNNSFTRANAGDIANIYDYSYYYNYGHTTRTYGNNYYAPSSFQVNTYNGTYYNVTDLATYYDTGAANMEMPFISSTDLHVDTSLDAPASDYYAGVATDIDGDARSTSTPVMGADEGTGVVIKHNGSIDITLSASAICAGNYLDVSVDATGTMSSGNSYTVELSDANGDFSSSTTLATVSSTGDETINVQIPSTASAGNYKIRVKSSNPSNTSNEASLAVNVADAITMSALSDVCVDAADITLGNATPAGGTYSGDGVSNGVFSPATAGVGSHSITYTYTNATGCTSTASTSITVNALPTVTMGSLSAVCANGGDVTLSGGSPSGGTYSGTYVSNGVFDPAAAGSGTHDITYTYTNASGCTASASTTIKVYSVPTADAGADKVVYYGYSPMSSATLSGSASGGSGSYTYKWSTGATTASITVSPTSTTTYTLTVKDGNGCTVTDDVKVKVIDVRCGNKNDKVTICHNGNDLCVDASAVPAHLNHGCKLGSCSLAPVSTIVDEEEDIHVSLYPNPNNGHFILDVDMHVEQMLNITVTNVMGQQVAVLANGIMGGTTINADLSTRSAGVYLVTIRTANETIVKRVVISR